MMKKGLGITLIIIILFLSGVVHSADDEDDSEELQTPPTFFKYKVKALNTALYYILRALQEDLSAGDEVDISFLKRINILASKIKEFHGKVDETNALTLGELKRKFPGYLLLEMEQEGLNFDEYTTMATAADV